MKKLLTYGCLLLGIIFFSNDKASAQDFSVGGGVAYGLEIEAIGIQGGALYVFTDELRGAADISIFFPEDENGIDVGFWELNANVHYLFVAEEATKVYALGGLNYATSSASAGGISVSDSEAGLNVGGGAEFGMDFGGIYIEAKYAISNFDQLALAAGVRFNI